MPNRIIDELHREHREIRRLLSECAAQDGHPQRTSELCAAVRRHYTVETGVFLPAVAQVSGDPELLERAALEYAAVLELLNELMCPSARHRGTDGEMQALRLFLSAHFDTTESEHGLFLAVAAAPIDWADLETRMALRRQSLDCTNEAVTVPR